MRLLLTLALAISTCAARADIFVIGNSLTADALYWELDGPVGNQIQCSQTLSYILANPANPCVPANPAFGTWDVALATHTFDVLTVQPWGSTVAQDFAAISTWMDMQPSAKIVLHTSYPWRTSANFQGEAQTIIAQADQLLGQLSLAYPGRDIVRDYVADALLLIAQNAGNGVGPFASVGAVYRDDIHLLNSNTGEGGFLAHNLSRAAIGQPLDLDKFPTMDPTHRDYLIGMIGEFAAVPEVSPFALACCGGIAWGLVVRFRRAEPIR